MKKAMKKIVLLAIGLFVIATPEIAEARRRRHHKGHHRRYRHGGYRGFGRGYGYGGGLLSGFGLGLSSPGYGYWNRGPYLDWGFPRYARQGNWRKIRRRLNREIDDLQNQIDDLEDKLAQAESRSEKSGYKQRIDELTGKVKAYQKDLEEAKR